jgi:hypothetical protein
MFSKTIDRITLARDGEVAKACLSDVLMQIADLKDCYPEFDSWVKNKVIPGLYDGERSLLLEYRKGLLAGFAIIKDDGLEQKLCCLRVLDDYQNSYGMGVRLFKRAFDELGTEKPLLSVAEERLPAFSKIFNYFGFELGATYDGLYRVGRTEYAYNGLLDLPAKSPHASEKSSALLSL